MARAIKDIKAEIGSAFVQDAQVQNLYALDPAKSFEDQFSNVSVESILFVVVAFCIWTLETLFDIHRFEVDAVIAAQKAHTTRWYADKALSFQLGATLVPEQDYYDNYALTPAQVAAQKVVKHASVVEIPQGLRVKLAGESGGDLASLPPATLAAVAAYLNLVKDAGVKLFPVSLPADSLKLNIKIFYDPLVLSGNGARLDGTAATPVADAIGRFLKGRPFDSLFVVAQLVDALQKVDGVVIPHVVSASAAYGTLPYKQIEATYQPDGGYLRIVNPADLAITYVPHAPIYG